MLRIALALLVVSCGAPPLAPAPAPPPPPPPDPYADCARAGANIATILHVDADHAVGLAAVVEHHCHSDAWSAAAQACVAAAVDHDAALRCAHDHLTEQQHELVVADMRAEMPQPPPHAAGSQAEIAARDNDEGKDLMAKGRFAEASAKFRDAAARAPETLYFFNLCASLYQEGKFGEALTACNAADRDATSAELHADIGKLEQRITTDAKAQRIDLHP